MGRYEAELAARAAAAKAEAETELQRETDRFIQEQHVMDIATMCFQKGIGKRAGKKLTKCDMKACTNAAKLYFETSDYIKTILFGNDEEQ